MELNQLKIFYAYNKFNLNKLRFSLQQKQMFLTELETDILYDLYFLVKYIMLLN